MCANTLRDEQFIPEGLSSDRVEIEVLPKLGANLASLKVDGDELIHFDKAPLLADGESYTGCFMMFPTPCRLTDSKYTFGGREIRQTKYGQDVFIHGLLRDETFTVTRGENSLTCSITIDEKHPVYEGYPFPCTFSIEFSLLASLKVGAPLCWRLAATTLAPQEEADAHAGLETDLLAERR